MSNSSDGSAFECAHGVWVETCVKCDTEMYERLHEIAETYVRTRKTAFAALQAEVTARLAESQAREQQLREALRLFDARGATTDDWFRERPKSRQQARLEAALALPVDYSALRAFMLKVAHAIYDTDAPAPPEAVADAVLKGEGA